MSKTTAKQKRTPVYQEFENAIKRTTKLRRWDQVHIMFLAYGYALESRDA